MASDTQADGEPDDTRRSRTLTNRIGIDRRHSVGTTAIAVVLAVVCGLYAGWLVADFGLRWPALVVVAVVGGVFFYAHPTRAGVLATGLYTLAVLVVVTPVFLDFAFVFAAGSYGIHTPWPFVLSLADLVFLVVFVVLGLVLAGIAYLITRRADTGDARGSDDTAVRDG